MRIIFIRQQDYWIFPLSVIGVLGVIILLYAGVMSLRLLGGFVGLSTLYFIMYIIRKNYSRKLASVYMLICLMSAILTTLGIHVLTN